MSKKCQLITAGSNDTFNRVMKTDLVGVVVSISKIKLLRHGTVTHFPKLNCWSYFTCSGEKIVFKRL